MWPCLTVCHLLNGAFGLWFVKQLWLPSTPKWSPPEPWGWKHSITSPLAVASERRTRASVWHQLTSVASALFWDSTAMWRTSPWSSFASKSANFSIRTDDPGVNDRDKWWILRVIVSRACHPCMIWMDGGPIVIGCPIPLAVGPAKPPENKYPTSDECLYEAPWCKKTPYSRYSMYGIFTYIYHKELSKCGSIYHTLSVWVWWAEIFQTPKLLGCSWKSRSN